MDPQYLEDLAELAYEYRKAKFEFAELAKSDANDAKIARANDAMIRAANKLLLLAAEGST